MFRSRSTVRDCGGPTRLQELENRPSQAGCVKGKAATTINRNRRKKRLAAAAAILLTLAVLCATQVLAKGRPGTSGKNIPLPTKWEITDTTAIKDDDGGLGDGIGLYVDGVDGIHAKIDSDKGEFHMATIRKLTSLNKVIMERWIRLDFTGAQFSEEIPLPVDHDGGVVEAGCRSMGGGRREYVESDDGTYTSTGVLLNILLMAGGTEKYTSFGVRFGFVNGDGDVETWELSYDGTTLGGLTAMPVKVTAGGVLGDPSPPTSWTITSLGNAVLRRVAVSGNEKRGGDSQIVYMPIECIFERLP